MSALSYVLPAFLAVVLAGTAWEALGHRASDRRRTVSKRRPAPAAWWLLVAAVPSFAGVLFLDSARSASTTVVVDMTVERGGVVELFVNDPSDEPFRVAVVPNVRTVYEFRGVAGALRFLRLDPTDTADARFEIFRIVVRHRGERIAGWGPAKLAKWSRANVAGPAEATGAFSGSSTSPDPMLSSAISVVAPEGPVWVRSVAESIRDPGFPTLLFVGAFFVFLLAGLGDRAGLADARAAAIVGALAFPLTFVLSSLPGAAPSVDEAVGFASYVGYPKFHDYWASIAVLVLAVAAGTIARRSGPELPAAPEPDGERPAIAWRRWAVHGAVLVLIAAYFQPSLTDELAALEREVLRPRGWDDGVNLAWDYMLQRGLLPYRDFWFPYAGFYLHHLLPTWGPLAVWVHNLLVLGVLYAGIHLANGRRLGGSLLLFALFLAPLAAGLFGAWSRYLLAIDLVLLHLALEVAPQRRRGLGIAFGFWVGYVLFFEPSQLVYGFVAIAALTLISSLEPQGSGGARFPQRLAHEIRAVATRIGVPTAAGVAAVAGLLAARGMLGGFLEFHSSLGAQAIYGGVPADVASWTRPLLNPDSVYLVLFMLAAIAIRCRFSRPPHPRAAGSALLLVVAAGALVMQKQVLRPHIMQQVQIYPLLGVLLYAALAWPRRTRSQVVVAGLFVGTVLGISHAQGTPSSWGRAVAIAPARTLTNVQVLLERRAELAAAAAARFDRRRLAAFESELAVFETLRQEFGWRDGDELFVLGDNAVPYLLAGHDPPYNINFYNSSPLVEQQRTVDWLERRKPRFVLWNPADAGFDGVPHPVRLPLIYGYVIERYVPAGSSGPFEILVRTSGRREGGSDFWRRHLGETVDLGDLVRRSDPSLDRECDDDSCVEMLVVGAGEEARSTAAAEIVVRAGADRWSVRFDLDPDRQRYLVNPRRLWFWSFATAAGAPRIESATRGLTARLERRALASEVLY